MQITWENFGSNNIDARGIRFKFEDLCRQIFINENISGNRGIRYLHANPNNPGLEAEPIFDEISKRWIGFQAKYFEDAVDYNQIEESVRKIISNYTGKKGIVNHVYLFSNKPITTTAAGFVRAQNMLQKYNISLELITDNTILDIVRSKYEYLGKYYFGAHNLTHEWFENHANNMYDVLGERFNSLFHISTSESTDLSLFVNDQEAVDYLNAKKHKVFDLACRHFSMNRRRREYLGKLKDTVSTIPDISLDTFGDSFEWKQILCKALQPYITEFNTELQDLHAKRKKLMISLSQETQNNDDLRQNENQLNSVNNDINEIDELLEMLDVLVVSESDRKLLQSKVLLIYGKAGTGKSQLLAHESQLLIKEGRECLLLISGIYFSNDPIQKQIMNNLNLDYSLFDLIDILETIGQKKNRIIPIFIDALNETCEFRLWKNGLSSIIDKVNSLRWVKLVLSYRTEYENMIIPESIIIKKRNNEIPSVFHNGFADTGIQAVKEFLNYYNIPFSPLEYFGYEMTNPLFLTLYCKNYTGSETSLPQLYERLIKSVNIKLHHSLHLSQNGYTEDINILKPLIMEIASVLISSKRRYITENEIECLDYWRKYNLQSSIVIHHLKGEGILHTHVFNGQEELFFSFDQMNDYFGAEAILKRDCSKEEMRSFLSNELLGIKNGNLENYNNIEIFINCCALFSEKFREECIDIINSVLDEDDRSTIFSYYLESFQWRTSIYLSSEEFNSLCQKCCFRCEDIWRMLISNSVRTNHLFNADFLHNVLSTYSLCERDYLWTIYINGLPSNDNERIVQLVNLYNEGGNLDFRHPKQIELLLTVLGWLLTSSNRWLRDVTSKAMIEILKEHFQYCKVLIRKFKDVNDPYVVQRLYGIILGACCKRIHSEDNLYQDLAEYIYCNVFEQEIVYEDILLRDYARLLIERFLNEYPNYCGIIKKKRITPPYTSMPIPEIEDQHYLDKEFSGAIRCIISSMRFDGMGWYGDFGRYVFQRALNSFDVNEYQIFNYAVFHIINEIGFSEEFFNDYDTFSRGYDRGRTIKTERIGKKYQWITMYHVLARISDNCVMKETWQSTSDSSIKYEGPWEPYIRDFDPTLNQNFLDLRDAPSFPLLDEYRAKSIADHKMEDVSAEFKQKVWINKKSYFLEHLQDSLAISDKYGTQWVFLTKYCDTDRHNIEVDKLHEWSWLYAYFMTSSQIDSCNEQLKKGRSLLSSEITSLLHTYTIYNREYPWSPSCHCITNDTWVNYSIGTGEYEEIPVNSDSSFDDLIYKQLLAIYSADNEGDSEEKTGEADMHQTINKRTRSKEIVKDIGCILASTIELLWEEEYDASKESAISICHPCPKFIEDMKLTQKQDDGAYYDTSDKIAAFDTNLSQGLTGVMVRKDILDRFLAMNELRLVWFVDAEKAVHADGYMISMLSRWEGMLLYNKGSIEGDIYIRTLDTGKTKHAQAAPGEASG